MLPRIRMIASEEKCNVREDGMQALLRLSGGDMRRILNVLQSCHMAHGEISEETVYNCTGKPLPRDIKSVFDSLMNAPIQQTFELVHFFDHPPLFVICSKY